MGNLCGPCFKGEAEAELMTPDMETKRRQMAAAAERRLQDQERRGVKNIESVKRNQQKSLELEKAERENAMSGGPGLRWTQD